MRTYVYILVSMRDGLCYVGRTSNLLRRYRQHAEGLVASTKHRRPLIVAHWESFSTKQEASVREKWLKSPAATQMKQAIRAAFGPNGSRKAGDVAQLGARTGCKLGDVAQLGER